MSNHYDVVLTKHMADEWFAKSRSPDHEYEFQHILAADIMLAVRVPKHLVSWLTQHCSAVSLYEDDPNSQWHLLYGEYEVTFRFKQSRHAVMFKLIL